MTQKEITIAGNQYPVVFDLQTMLNYEQNAGRSFFSIDFNNISLDDRVNLIHAAVISANENAKLTIGDIKGQRKFDDLNSILTASNIIIMLSSEFFPIPEIEKQNEQEQPEADGDKNAKN